MSDTAITAARLKVMGFVADTARRRRGGGWPTDNSDENETAPTLVLKSMWFWLTCWDDFSEWWVSGFDRTGSLDGGYAIETHIPPPASVEAVAALCRLLGVVTLDTPLPATPDNRGRLWRAYGGSKEFHRFGWEQAMRTVPPQAVCGYQAKAARGDFDTLKPGDERPVCPVCNRLALSLVPNTPT